MVARGGGARDIELFVHPLPSRGQQMLVVHLLVDTRDAMGANLVNGMCEGVAPLIETITGGEVFLRILSNLTDRSLARAHCKIPVDQLAGKGYTRRAGARRDHRRGGLRARRSVPRGHAQQGHHERHRPGRDRDGQRLARDRGRRARLRRAQRALFVAHRLVGGRAGQPLRPHRAADQGRHRRRAARVEPDRGSELAAARRRVRDRARAGHGGRRPRAELRGDPRARDRRHPEGPHDAARAQRRDGGRRAEGDLRRGARPADPKRRDQGLEGAGDRHRDSGREAAREAGAQDASAAKRRRWASATAR